MRIMWELEDSSIEDYVRSDRVDRLRIVWELEKNQIENYVRSETRTRLRNI